MLYQVIRIRSFVRRSRSGRRRASLAFECGVERLGPGVLRPGADGSHRAGDAEVGGVARDLRRRCFWILVSNIRRQGWDDEITARVSAEVLDLLDAGRSIADLAHVLETIEQSIYMRRR